MSPDPTPLHFAGEVLDEAMREKVPQSTNTSSFLEFEESIAGKPGGKWVTPDNSAILSTLAMLLALFFGIFGGMYEEFLFNGYFELAAKAEAQGAGTMIIDPIDLSIPQSQIYGAFRLQYSYSLGGSL